MTGRRPKFQSSSRTFLTVLDHYDVGRLLNVQTSSHRRGELPFFGKAVFAVRTERPYEGLVVLFLKSVSFSWNIDFPRETLANAVPPVVQIRWVDEEYVSDDDIPREHGEVECIFNSQVEQQAQQ